MYKFIEILLIYLLLPKRYLKRKEKVKFGSPELSNKIETSWAEWRYSPTCL